MTETEDNNPGDDRAALADQEGPGGERALAAVLSGELRCISCRYDLTGLSVTTTCPECGVPVRATLLAVVDPQATSFVPLARPRMAAMGLVLWTAGALLAALAVLLIRMFDFASGWTPHVSSIRSFGVVVPVFGAVSALGALMLLRPHAKCPRRVCLASLAGVLLYVPLAALLWRLHAQFDVMHGAPYVDHPIRESDRVLLRLGIGLLMLAIALLLRPTIREYAARSVLMRTGQVTRQTLSALASAVVIVMAGDLLHFLAVEFEPLRNVVLHILWLSLVVIGSAMILIGFLGMFWDSVRLYPVLRKGPTSLGDVVSKEAVHAA